MEIAEKCMGSTFSLTGEDGAECFEGVDYFNYFGRVPHRSDEDWAVVHQSIWRERQVWGKLGKFLRRDGAEPIVSAKFYHAVVQAVLLFGSETWVLTAAMIQKLEGFHVSFLRQVTGMKGRRLRDEAWK